MDPVLGLLGESRGHGVVVVKVVQKLPVPGGLASLTCGRCCRAGPRIPRDRPLGLTSGESGPDLWEAKLGRPWEPRSIPPKWLWSCSGSLVRN